MKALSLMACHLAAFHAATAGLVLETREAPEPTLADLSSAIARIATGFEEFKSANDARIREIETKGAADPVTLAKLAKIEGEIADAQELKSRIERVETRANRPGTGSGELGAVESAEAREYRNALYGWIRAPKDHAREVRAFQAGQALETRMRAGMGPDEARAVQVVTSTGAAGGFALPEQVEAQIARLGLDLSPLRQLATVRTVSTTDYKELVETGGVGYEWVGEADPRGQTATGDLVEIAPTFGMISAKPRISEESADDLSFNVEQWLLAGVSEAHAKGEGIAFISGDGVKKPTGFLAGPAPVATADGGRAFGTLQFVASGQAAAMPTNADPLFDLVYSLRARYRANATWLGGKLTFSALRKLKDTTGAYLWTPSLALGQPDLFMGYRVAEAEDMPAVAANAFPLAFGDFREGYLIADRVGLRITRDDVTVPGFINFYVRKRTSGKMRNSQAIKLLKISA